MSGKTPDGPVQMCARCGFFMVEGSSIVPSKIDSRYCVTCFCIIDSEKNLKKKMMVLLVAIGYIKPRD